MTGKWQEMEKDACYLTLFRLHYSRARQNFINAKSLWLSFKNIYSRLNMLLIEIYGTLHSLFSYFDRKEERESKPPQIVPQMTSLIIVIFFWLIKILSLCSTLLRLVWVKKNKRNYCETFSIENFNLNWSLKKNRDVGKQKWLSHLETFRKQTCEKMCSLVTISAALYSFLSLITTFPNHFCHKQIVIQMFVFFKTSENKN